MKLYVDVSSVEALVVTVGLKEKQKEFKTLSGLDDVKMALHLSPDGKLPLLVAPGGQKISGYQQILQFIGYEVDKLEQLDIGVNLVNRLTLATCFHAKDLTQQIRWPFHTNHARLELRKAKTELIKHLATKFSTLRTKLEADMDFCSSIDNALNILSETELFLKAIEDHLCDEERIGVWLHNATFSAPDCVLAAILVRLCQLGQDTLWREGNLPGLNMFEVQALQRPSVVDTAQRKVHENDYEVFDKEPVEVKHARYAMYGALALGGAYIFKKVFLNQK